MSVIDQEVIISQPVEDETEQPMYSSGLPSTIRVIGSDVNGKTLIWITDKRVLREFASLRMIDKRVIQQLAGGPAITAYMKYVRDEFGADRNAYDVAQTIIATSSRNHIFTDDRSIGQGIYTLGEDVVAVTGDRAYLIRHHESEEHFTVSPIDQPIFNKTLIGFDPSERWIEPETLLSDLKQVNKSSSIEIVEALANHLSCWNFQQPIDRYLAIGMILATPVQHCLPFRSHVWISGPSNCGKSAFKDFLKRLWPYAHEIQNKTTLAGLRNTIASSSLPMLMDECEKSKYRDEILQMLRSATRKGEMRIGVAGGGVISFSLRHVHVGTASAGGTTAIHDGRVDPRPYLINRSSRGG